MSFKMYSCVNNVNVIASYISKAIFVRPWDLATFLGTARVDGKVCYTSLVIWVGLKGGWGIYASVKYTITSSDNGLAPDRRQAVIWTNAGLVVAWLLGTYFSKIITWIQTFSYINMQLKMPPTKLRLFCPSLNVFSLRASLLDADTVPWIDVVKI